MSMENMSSPESSAPLSAKRLPARSRSGKPAKPAKTPKPTPADPSVEKSAPVYPVFDSVESMAGEGISESAASGESPPQEGVKRNKRRRKKGKGGGSANSAQAALADPSAEPVEETSAGAAATTPHPARQARLKLDSESVSKLAWKIYLAEVSEEGVALIADSDAKELTRRCFRLAEIFVEEQTRRR
jgi:hypothetical protein